MKVITIHSQIKKKKKKKKILIYWINRTYSESNKEPIDLQSIALPLSYKSIINNYEN